MVTSVHVQDLLEDTSPTSVTVGIALLEIVLDNVDMMVIGMEVLLFVSKVSYQSTYSICLKGKEIDSNTIQYTMEALYWGHFGTLILVLITEVSSIQRSLNTLQY